MSNYCVTGSLNRAADELDRAVLAIGISPVPGPEEKLRAKLIRLRDQTDRALAAAKKLIPGGWKPPSTTVHPATRYGFATDQSHRGDGAEAVAP